MYRNSNIMKVLGGKVGHVFVFSRKAYYNLSNLSTLQVDKLLTYKRSSENIIYDG